MFNLNNLVLFSFFLLFTIAALFVGLVPGLSPRLISTLENIFSSVSASIVFLAVLNTGAVSDWFSKNRFRSFFKGLAKDQPPRIACPDFELSDAAQEALKVIEKQRRVYSKHSARTDTERFVDIPSVFSSNDLLAAVMLSSEFGKYVATNFELVSDGQCKLDQTRSFISVGLTSNDLTDLYLGTDSQPLVEIGEDAQGPTIKIETAEGPKTFGLGDKLQYSLILRYQPDPVHYPDCVWILCGGLAAPGTPAAAWYLAHNWQRLSKETRRGDFAIVISTSDKMGAYMNGIEVARTVRLR